VRRARWNAVDPRDDIPADRADERTENDVLIDDFGIDRPFADGGGDLQVKDEIRDDVERRGECDRLLRLQHAGRDDRRDGISGVVKTVHEVERERDYDEEGDCPDCELNRMHRLVLF
jgi:hypothetical protein